MYSRIFYGKFPSNNLYEKFILTKFQGLRTDGRRNVPSVGKLPVTYGDGIEAEHRDYSSAVRRLTKA